MKIVLINPPHLYLKQPDSQAPLGLLYVAASLEQAGHEVVIENYSSTQWEDIKIPDADLYGITGTLLDVTNINRLIELIKPKPVIVGGPCYVVSECIIGATSIVKGEGELIIHEIVKDFPNLQPLYTAKPISDLNALHFPARHLLNYLGGNIFAKNRKYKGDQSTVISSSRGCPHKCAFCSSPGLWSRVAFRSPENVIAEMKHVIEKYGIYQFRFSDDSFTAIPGRAIEIANLAKDLDVSWRVSVRVNPHEVKMWEAMYKGGCKEVSFGIESFDQDVLDRLNKRTTIQDNINAIRNAKKAGMVVRVLFMVGTPGQTKDTMDKNKEVITRLSKDIDSVACTAFLPLPGSDIWHNPAKYRISVTNIDYTNYNFYMFDNSGVRDMPVAISHWDRDDAEVIKESLDFRQFLINNDLANRG